MPRPDLLVIVACAFGLFLTFLTIWKGRSSPLAAPLALLILDLTTWNFADMAWHMSGEKAFDWRVIDHFASPLGLPLGLDFVLVFVGRRRSPIRWTLWASWALALPPALLAPVAYLSPLARQVLEGPAWEWWNTVHLGLLFPLGVVLLVQHLIRSEGQLERARTGAVLGAISCLALSGFTEFLPGPGAGVLGYLTFTVTLTMVVLRGKLFETPIPSSFLPIPGIAGLLGVFVWVTVFQALGTSKAVMILILSVIGLITVALVQGAYLRRLQTRQRVQRLAELGRFSDQLAHNLKNPIAALKGAAQFFEGELQQGRSLEEQRRFTTLLLEQVNRLQTVVEDYRRLGRIEPILAPVQLNSVVHQVLDLQSFIDPERVRVQARLDESLPVLHADLQLLAQALENLLRNAVEAMPHGGAVTVSTGWEDKSSVALSVRDTGVGMDDRMLERLQEFYTTKPSGTGLGLAHARRVAEAHHGRIRISSRVQRGTTVTLVLPVPRDSHA